MTAIGPFMILPIWPCAWWGTWIRKKSCALQTRCFLRERTRGIERDYGAEENETAAAPAVETAMEVSLPLFLCGYKCDGVPDGEENLRQELIGNMACDILFGESSPLYNRLYTEGLINGEFGGGYELLPGISFVVTGGRAKVRAKCIWPLWKKRNG